MIKYKQSKSIILNIYKIKDSLSYTGELQS
jgi:hypothetical protein